ncbi:hypothetical protein ZEAMMB73_Zm00001d050238 [Zea mays]|uniref:Uncharacterized protein n=1 Tax=Zea mays TaxID=4577 RepID=A0A1D6Q0J2_MAIZE|nr:hypothetical protein ZEAMMB73_Zm00001d050238 [Zea mays]
MESPPLTAEAIAFTEKKMDMTLEDIIKMSKKKNPGGKNPPRQPGVLAQRRSNLGGSQFAATKQAAKKAAAMPMRSGAVYWKKPRY